MIPTPGETGGAHPPLLHCPPCARAQYMGRCPAARIQGVCCRLALAACTRRGGVQQESAGLCAEIGKRKVVSLRF